MSYMFESVDDAIEYTEALDAAIMPVDGGYLVTVWNDYYHRISEEAGCLYDGGWRATDPDIINRLIEEYQPENNTVTCDWACAIMVKLHDIEKNAHYRQMQESIDPGCTKQYWYAVQAERSDGWDYGSYLLPEAVGMLKAEGGTNGLIAVIDEETNTCVKEIAYDEL